MKRNENNTDRAIRAGLAAVLVAVAVWAGVASVAGILLLVLAAVLLVTAAVGFCPLYYALGISTYPTPYRTRHPHVGVPQSS
jgi:Protein of unknown function (DUF2892)